TTYAVLQKRLEAPGVSADKAGPAVVTKEKVTQQMIWVKVHMDNGHPVFKVEDEVVSPENLESKLRTFVKATSKTQLLFEHDYDVPQSAVVAVIDAAKGAGMERVSLGLPEKGK